MNKRFRLGFGHRNGHVGTAPRTSKHDVHRFMLVVNVADVQFLPAPFVLNHESQETIRR
jgi:hypothetical protein